MNDDDKTQDRAGDESSHAAAACSTGEVTLILSRIERGEPQVAGQLLPLVYEELRKLAAARMIQEQPDQTLQATALVHEAYIRLVDVDKVQHWDSRGHFFAAAAEAMRRILVEQARRKAGPRSGGTHRRRELSGVEPEWPGRQPDLLALDESLEKLEKLDRRAAEIVKLRFFVGMTNEQAAQSLGISVSTAKADWAYAKCWLRAELLDSPSDE